MAGANEVEPAPRVVLLNRDLIHGELVAMRNGYRKQARHYHERAKAEPKGPQKQSLLNRMYEAGIRQSVVEDILDLVQHHTRFGG